MYVLESSDGEYVTIVNTEFEYKSSFILGAETADQILVKLNKPGLLLELASHRFSFEVAGLDVGNGVRVKSDRESQAQIASAFVALTNSLIPDTDFKSVSGWSVMTDQDIRPIAKAAAAHGRACFRGERVVSLKIEAAATMDEILSISVQDDFGAAYRAAYAEVMQPAGA